MRKTLFQRRCESEPVAGTDESSVEMTVKEVLLEALESDWEVADK